jgi:hypothetical protein
LPDVDHPADESFDRADGSVSGLLSYCGIAFTIFLIIKMNGSGRTSVEEDS